MVGNQISGQIETVQLTACAGLVVDNSNIARISNHSFVRFIDGFGNVFENFCLPDE